jgi:ubiquinone/menaquinone biosynthesis C-methylase UbiE
VFNWKRIFRRSEAPLTADLRRRIRNSFEDAARDEEHFPSTIDPRIYHVQLLLEYFGDLTGRRALDAGCGKGRFARILHERYPECEIWGLDIALAMLKCVPPGIRTCAGSMTELPFLSGAFDVAYATESLEHAVDIPQAVAELCRVVKPGGRLVIIDKNAEQWGRLETPDWEKWFRRKELERLLARHCREVSSRFISYWEDVAPDGLFLAWLARK